MGQSNGVLFEELGFCVSEVSFNGGFTVYTVQMLLCANPNCKEVPPVENPHKWGIFIIMNNN